MVLALAQAQSKPNFSGAWKANIAKSDFGGRPAPDSQVETITHQDPALKISVATTGEQGQMDYDINFTTDGKETTSQQGDSVETTITAGWEGGDLVVDTKGNFNGTKFSSKERWTLSGDGKVLVVARHIASGMGEFDQKMQFDKQ